MLKFAIFSRIKTFLEYNLHIWRWILIALHKYSFLKAIAREIRLSETYFP